MDPQQIQELLCSLIEYPSFSGQEQEVALYLTTFLESRSWKVDRLPVDGSRFNILAYRSQPRILLSTHMDVVPGPEKLFCPRISGSTITGRGACDAKGALTAMIAAADGLSTQNDGKIGLLFVVGEETVGDGAKSAAPLLKEREIRFIVNGEPTEGKVCVAHKGALSLEFRYSGRSCHSGYPDSGEDANAKLVRDCSRILQLSLPSDRVLGDTTINLGRIEGGSAPNIVSDNATLKCSIRTVTDNRQVFEAVRTAAAEADSVTVKWDTPAMRLLEVPGFESSVASYATDIPNLLPSGAEFVLYGPGSILKAHTDEESIRLEEVVEAAQGYQRICEHLFSILHRQ